MSPIISVSHVSKTYASGFQALKDINLDISAGEIFALLGPNGAGKTTLISVVCGIVNPSERQRHASTATTSSRTIAYTRSMIGLVPQELTTDIFEIGVGDGDVQPRPVRQAGQSRATSKRCCKRSVAVGQDATSKITTLSGGMKRRVMIAKALSHEPRILFLDEPTAGVDVELRKDMWEIGARRCAPPASPSS